MNIFGQSVQVSYVRNIGHAVMFIYFFSTPILFFAGSLPISLLVLLHENIIRTIGRIENKYKPEDGFELDATVITRWNHDHTVVY